MSLLRKFIGSYVIIRSYSDGIHFGVLQDVETTGERFSCIITKGRRIHYWEGAASTQQIALSGVKAGRIAVELPEYGVADCILCLPCETEAIENLQNQPEWKV